MFVQLGRVTWLRWQMFLRGIFVVYCWRPRRMRPLKSLDRTELLLIGGLALFVFSSAFFDGVRRGCGLSHAHGAAYSRRERHSTTNTFSYTAPNEPWLLHQWLGTIIYYGPYRLGAWACSSLSRPWWQRG